MADRSSLPDEPAVPESREPAAVAGEPSDDELLTLDQLRNSWNVQADAANSWDELGADEIVFWAQKQALNRWGQQAQPQPAAIPPPTRRQLMMLASDMGMASIDEAVMKFALAALARFGRPTTPPALPSMYIDPEHQGEDLELLQTFYRGCRTVVDGTDDEIHLRGIRAVLAARAALAAEPVGEGPTNWPAYFMRVADMQAREIEGMLRQSQPGMVEALPPPPPAPAVVPVAIPGEQWQEGDGPCLWWRFPINEPPWAGDPRDDDWPGYHTHFTRIVYPVLPTPQGGEVEG